MKWRRAESHRGSSDISRAELLQLPSQHTLTALMAELRALLGQAVRHESFPRSCFGMAGTPLSVEHPDGRVPAREASR